MQVAQSNLTIPILFFRIA